MLLLITGALSLERERVLNITNTDRSDFTVGVKNAEEVLGFVKQLNIF